MQKNVILGSNTNEKDQLYFVVKLKDQTKTLIISSVSKKERVWSNHTLISFIPGNQEPVFFI